MVSDFLFCGACFLKFRLCDINLFIEHKKSSCVSYSTESKSPADNFVANLLECVQCFRKFPTPWPLLLHVQSEHQLLFVNAPAQLPPDTSIHDTSRSVCFSQRPPVPSEDTDVNNSASHSIEQLPEQHFASVGTQTVLSSLKKLLSKPSKRGYPSCCIPAYRNKCLTDVSNKQPCVCVDNSDAVCHCASASCGIPVSSPCVCVCCCSFSSPLSNTSCILRTSGAHLLPTPHCNSYASNETTNQGKKPDAFSGGECCMSYVSRDTRCCLSANATVTASESLTFSCCPCPPVVKKPSTTSSGIQTDLEPDFGDLNYSDIVMLLTSPTSSVPADPSDALDLVLKSEPPVCTLTNKPEKREQTPPSTELMIGKPVILGCEESLGVPNATSVPTEEQLTPPDAFPFSASASLTNPVALSILDVPSITHRETDHSEEMLDESCSKVSMVSVESSSQPLSMDTQLETRYTYLAMAPQFTCKQCGRVYRQKVHLKKHILTHHIQKKPYECPLCNYTTVEKSHLTVHIRTHTGEKPFRCRACEYASAQNCTLKSHYIRKHPDDRVRCSNCFETFYTELELEKHERMCLFGSL